MRIVTKFSRGKLARARQRRGLKQRDLARMIGWSQGAVGHVESGRSDPSVAFLEAVATALRVDIRAFFGR
jgi:transcriptional regulator with XRE-family HTH domain